MEKIYFTGIGSLCNKADCGCNGVVAFMPQQAMVSPIHSGAGFIPSPYTSFNAAQNSMSRAVFSPQGTWLRGR